MCPVVSYRVLFCLVSYSLIFIAFFYDFPIVPKLACMPGLSNERYMLNILHSGLFKETTTVAILKHWPWMLPS